jgi:hypothetical protein
MQKAAAQQGAAAAPTPAGVPQTIEERLRARAAAGPVIDEAKWQPKPQPPGVIGTAASSLKSTVLPPTPPASIPPPTAPPGNHWYWSPDQPGFLKSTFEAAKEALNPIPLLRGAASYFTNPPDIVGTDPEARNREDWEKIQAAGMGVADVAKDIYWDLKHGRVRTAGGKAFGAVGVPILAGKVVSRVKGTPKPTLKPGAPVSPEEAAAGYQRLRARVPTRPPTEVQTEGATAAEKRLAEMYKQQKALELSGQEMARAEGADYFKAIEHPKNIVKPGLLLQDAKLDKKGNPIQGTEIRTVSPYASPVSTKRILGDLAKLFEVDKRNPFAPGTPIRRALDTLGGMKGDKWVEFDTAKKVAGELSQYADSGIRPRDRWEALAGRVAKQIRQELEIDLQYRAKRAGMTPAQVEASLKRFNQSWQRQAELWRQTPSEMKATERAYSLQDIERGAEPAPAIKPAPGISTLQQLKQRATELWRGAEQTGATTAALKKHTADWVEHSIANATNLRDMLTIVPGQELLGNVLDHLYAGRDFGRWKTLMRNGQAQLLTGHSPDLLHSIDYAFDVLADTEARYGKPVVDNMIRKIGIKLITGGRKVTAPAQILSAAFQNTETGRRFVQGVREQASKLPKKAQVRQAAGTAIRRGVIGGPAGAGMSGVQYPRAAAVQQKSEEKSRMAGAD